MTVIVDPNRDGIETKTIARSLLTQRRRKRFCGVIKLGVDSRLDRMPRFAQGFGHLSCGGSGKNGAAGKSVLVVVLNHGSDRFSLALVLILIRRNSGRLGGGGGGVRHGCERYPWLMSPLKRGIR